jgi:hypothetical protein
MKTCRHYRRACPYIQTYSIQKPLLHIQGSSKYVNSSKSQDNSSHNHNTSYILHIWKSKSALLNTGEK